MRRTFLIIIWLMLLVVPAYAKEERIVDIRVGLHKEYHRFVVELSGSAGYKVKRNGSAVSVLMNKVSSEYPPDRMPVTEYVRVKGLENVMDGAIKAARLDVVVADGAVVKQTNWDEPFRIVLDVYPGEPRKVSRDGAAEKAKPAGPDKKAKAAPEEVVKAGEKTVTFNNGWRWVYRKKIMGRLCQEELEDESLRNSVYASELGFKSDDKQELLKKTEEFMDLLKASGDTGTLEVLQQVYKFFDEEEDPSDLETALRLNPESKFKRLGQFLLAGYYEMQGFAPEAHGYYSLIMKDGSDGFIKSAASFQRGRLLYSEAKYGEAKKSFEDAGKRGFPGAPLWLASTLMIKGELDQAWEILKKVNITGETDQVSLMSLGDMYMIKGRFDSAREVFEKLRSLNAGDEMVSAFFVLKAGDAYMAEGRKAEAEELYTKTKERLKGEGWAMAALSLADSLSSGGADSVSLSRAEPLYRKVADGHFIGSEVTHLSIIDTLTRLGKYREAMAELDSFQKEFHTSAFRADLQLLSGRLVSGWLDSLYASGDYAGVVEVAAAHGSLVPFGKKADSYLKTGKAFVALGLYTDAIESLDSATRMGNGSPAEEAMMELGRVYLHQRDTAATERLYKAFVARFPRSRYMDEINGILLKTAFLEKEYRAAANLRDNGQPESMILRARSMAKLEDHEPAAGLFKKAAEILEGKGDRNGAAEAWIGLADSKFALGDFKAALEWYKKASLEFKDGSQDKSWALYRITQCYSRLDEKQAESEALKDLKGRGGEYGELASPIFGTTPKSF